MNEHINKLVLTQKSYNKLRGYVDNCENEISGLGKVKKLHNGFLITDIIILKQTVSGASTNLDIDAMGKFAFEIMQRGEKIEDYKLWWHSHADMSAFFSSTDIETIKQTKDIPYLISLVSNHANESKARLDVFAPFWTYAELEVQVETLADNKIVELCKREIKELVTATIGYSAESEYPYRHSEYPYRQMSELPPITKGKQSKRHKYLVKKSQHEALSETELEEVMSADFITDEIEREETAIEENGIEDSRRLYGL